MKTSDIPRPTTMRRIWVAGFQYAGETDAQMDARERQCREEDQRIDAEMERLWRWKCTPVWTLR